VLNHQTTGAKNDIEVSTEWARKMVCEYGMSNLGPLTFGQQEEQIFLGREISQHRDYSEATAIKIDNEITRIIDECYKRANDILQENLETLHRLASVLLDREVLDAEQIDIIIKGGTLPELKNEPVIKKDQQEPARKTEDQNAEGGNENDDDKAAEERAGAPVRPAPEAVMEEHQDETEKSQKKRL